MSRKRGLSDRITPGLRLYIFGVIGLACLSVLILVLFFRPVAPTTDDYLSREEGFSFYRLRLPEEKTALVEEELLNIRPLRTRWTEDDVARYWISPDPLILDLLQTENSKILEDIFEDVP